MGRASFASVCADEIGALKQLIQNRDAHPACRGQAIRALAILVGWGERSISEVEEYLHFLAREGLEHVKRAKRRRTWRSSA